MKQYIRILIVAIALMSGYCGHISYASEPKGVEQIENRQSQIKVTDGGLELTALDGDRTVRFEIYTITGRLVKSLDLRHATENVDLPSGCYIVRTPGRSQKVDVK